MISFVYAQVFLFFIGVFLLKLLKYRKIYINCFLVLLLLSIIYFLFLYELSRFCDSTKNGRIFSSLVEQIEKINNIDNNIFEKYIKDLKQNIYILQYDKENSDSENKFFNFIDFWEDVLKNGFLFDFKDYKILSEDSTYSSLLNKDGKILIDNSVILLREDFPYLYGRYNTSGKRSVFYDFILNLETNKFFKEELGKENLEYRKELDNAQKKIEIKKPVMLREFKKQRLRDKYSAKQ